MASTLRYEFYETDQTVTISVFDKGADPTQLSINFDPRKLSYQNGDKSLVLEPLKGQIDPAACNFTVGKVKVEIRLFKMVLGRWGELIGESPDLLAPFPASTSTGATTTTATTATTATATTTKTTKPIKNWEGITTEILSAEKEKTLDDDPNVSGDSTLNSFFQKLYGDADEDTKRAMMKSFSESGGTTLSTNWDEVKKGTVEVKPPAGSEWKKWN